ncbi:hypothetical protein ACMDCR_05195 [Labrys okinawensis]|uniref:hypothetical protein n=1 Tax=Labrys okinawensis TaxID=346911 RepID=UPI0039BC8A35
MTKLLEVAHLQAEIAALVPSSRTMRLAVAFWGNGAIEALGLPETLGHARIVCNLRLGGTNPNQPRAI